MRIAFNLLSLPGDKLYGVGTFLREMCVAVSVELARRNAELLVFHHADCDPGRLFGLEVSSRIRWVTVAGVARRGSRVMWEQLVLPRRLGGVDLLYSPNNINPVWLPSATRSIVTIHDLLSFDEETRFGFAQRAYLRNFTRAAVQRATRVITVSATSASDIETRLGVPAERISIVRNVVERPAHIASDLNAFGSSFLIIAGLHRDKRIDLAIRGFQRFVGRHPEYRLIVLGADQGALGELRTMTNELGLQDKVEFRGYVDATLKWSALSGCTGVLLFGRKEGFGIPVLEGMAVGKPSIVGPEGALPEIVGDAGIVVSPGDSEAVACAMETLAIGPGIPAATIARRYAAFEPAAQRHLFWETIFAAAE